MKTPVDWQARRQWIMLVVSLTMWAVCCLAALVGVLDLPTFFLKLFVLSFAILAGAAVWASKKRMTLMKAPAERSADMLRRRLDLFAVAEVVMAFAYCALASVFWASLLFLQCLTGMIMVLGLIGFFYILDRVSGPEKLGKSEG
jgi:hypothetical protein